MYFDIYGQAKAYKLIHKIIFVDSLAYYLHILKEKFLDCTVHRYETVHLH